MQKYDDPRPPINGELRRAVEVESGYACAVARCGEHTYLEVHHINENREDNRVEEHKRGRVYLMLRPDMHVSRRHRQSKSGQEPIHEMRSESSAEISH